MGTWRQGLVTYTGIVARDEDEARCPALMACLSLSLLHVEVLSLELWSRRKRLAYSKIRHGSTTPFSYL